MRKLLLVLGIAAAAFCAAPANAETLNHFNGYYVGAQGGYAFHGMVGLDLDNFSNTTQRVDSAACRPAPTGRTAIRSSA